MKCPFCNFIDTQVKDSRPLEDSEAIKRRRYCSSCGGRFTTTERRELPEIKVIKRSGAKKNFDAQKILQSLRIATRKRPVTNEQLEQIVIRILKKIEKSGETEITSTLIGQFIMNELAQVDQVAYIRYASVYQDFNAIDDFSEFIKIMMKKNEESK